MVPDGLEEVHYLRGLAARLRSLAVTEPHIGEQLQELAEEAERRANAIASNRKSP